MENNLLLESDIVPSDIIAIYEAHSKKNELTLLLLRILEAAYSQPGCTQKALCDRLQISKQRVNLFVRELTQKELLYYGKNEKDGRSRLLYVTDLGKAVVEDLRREISHSFGRIATQEVHTHTLPDGTVITHSHDEEHGHTHTHQHTKAVLDRLARSIGHLEKVRQMVEAGVDCSEVLIQLSAVKAAVNSTGKLILKDHIEHCLVDAIEHGDHQTIEELNKAIDQFIK